MNRRHLGVICLVILFSVAVQPQSSLLAQERAPDGVLINADGTPHYATFSICAIDPDSGECGVAVTTRVPFVGRAVPWVRAGVGAVATQAWTVVEYGNRGLDLLEEGLEPQEVLERLLADDDGRESRQLGIIDMQGLTAAHTGEENGNWAGSRQGPNYTVQGNILVNRKVIDAVADHLEATAETSMPLAERLILALEAGQAEGGDRRWGYFQSAAIRIANPESEGRGGDQISLAIDVGEHHRPVAEMKRIYYTTARRFGYRLFSEVRGSDVLELNRMLHALGYWRPELEEIPDPPPFDVDRSLRMTNPERYEELVDEYYERRDEYYTSYATFDDDVIEAVDAFRSDNSLEFQGNPRGLVDERFVEALRQAYYFRERSEGEEQ